MKNISILACFACAIFSINLANAAEGVIDVMSKYSVNETADRLENILVVKEFKVFNRIPHSEGAKKVGVELSETLLVIFGKPAVGSKLMKCQQSVAIDLPQKALIWENTSGEVFLSYNDPAHLSDRHDLSACPGLVEKVSSALNKITQAATH